MALRACRALMFGQIEADSGANSTRENDGDGAQIAA